ncbi:MAG: SAM-dependent methyltransferase, partial [Anaerolineales bacterium]
MNQVYAEDYEALLGSGLYAALIARDMLLPHEEREIPAARPERAYKVIEPQPLDFISYPYEWCFSQLKDAALLTLAAQRVAIEHDMSLKDASAFNVQFHLGRPLLMDTLSFEKLKEGEPWVAYRQFCQHFLAPLALMAYVDIELGKLMRVHIGGVPLSLASRMLPLRSRFRFSLLVHIHWHASAQRRYAGKDRSASVRARRMNRNALLGLVDSLQGAVHRL